MRMMRRGMTMALLVGLLTACGSPPDAQAQNPDPTPAGSVATPKATPALDVADAPDSVLASSLSRAFRTAAQRALPAVVFVTVEKDVQGQAGGSIPEPFRRFFQIPQGQQHFQEEGTGSGFIYDADGYIMTNNHVVSDATEVTVRLRDGREFTAKVVGSDPATDVAVVKIDPGDDKLPVVQFGSSEKLAVGDWVLALGNPLGFDFTVTAGIVSAKGRQLDRQEESDLQAFIQTDAAINPGNSGGPLVDLMGRVVGINTAISGGGNRWVGYGFAVPIDLARRVTADLIKYGHVRRPRLGVRVSDVTAVDAEAYGLNQVRGADINTVDEDSPAAKAGLQIGDVILAVNGKAIADATALTTTLAEMQPGDRVTLTIFRDGKQRKIDATLGEFTDNGEEATPSSSEGGKDTPQGRLGFSVQALTPQIAQQLGFDETSGVIVSGVVPNSNAAAAGVRRGQLIRQINHMKVSSVEDLQKAVKDLDPGQVVSLRVRDPQIGETIENFRARTN